MDSELFITVTAIAVGVFCIVYMICRQKEIKKMEERDRRILSKFEKKDEK